MHSSDHPPLTGSQRETPFIHLSPDTILAAVEQALGMYVSNLCRPLNSYINRVFELADEDGEGLIAKFYRPGRWSKQALKEEHDFLVALERQEVPVIAPLQLADGTTLAEVEGICFALFARKWGRTLDEYDEEQWLELGRLLGRTHAVGAGLSPRHRPVLHPEHSTRAQVAFLLENGLVPDEYQVRFTALTDTLIGEAAPLFSHTEMITLHGDCHGGNLIHRPDESFFLIDFDDMAVGPPVQDLWMLLPGTPEESLLELDLFLEGYRTFRSLDLRTLRLIEPLRGMRFLHYMAWCGYQVLEDGRSLVMPDFGTPAYWQRELDDLEDQLERMRERIGMELPLM